LWFLGCTCRGRHFLLRRHFFLFKVLISIGLSRCLRC
jgi:hypothetical protein